MTRKGRPAASSPKSSTSTTCGDLRRLATRASRRNRSRSGGLRHRSAWSTFSAAFLPTWSCSARYTEPMPPMPSSVSIRHRPSRMLPGRRSAAPRSPTASPSRVVGPGIGSPAAQHPEEHQREDDGDEHRHEPPEREHDEDPRARGLPLGEGGIERESQLHGGDCSAIAAKRSAYSGPRASSSCLKKTNASVQGCARTDAAQRAVVVVRAAEPQVAESGRRRDRRGGVLVLGDAERRPRAGERGEHVVGPPARVPELEREPAAARQEDEELAEQREILPQRGGELPQDRPERAAELRGGAEEERDVLGGPGEPLLVRDALGTLQREHERGRDPRAPRRERSRLGHPVEGRVDLDGGEPRRVRGEHARRGEARRIEGALPGGVAVSARPGEDPHAPLVPGPQPRRESEAGVPRRTWTWTWTWTWT